MGRQQHLTRLALGRSPFQDEAEDSEHLSKVPRLEDTAEGGQHEQQYDPKGRPIDSAMEATKSEMRDAQNSIMALVGVVEDRDIKELAQAQRFRIIGEERRRVLAHEHDLGDELDLFAGLCRSLALWSAKSLTMRFQIGLYNPDLSFMDVVLAELTGLSGTGWKGFFSVIFPGAPSYIVHLAIRSVLALSAEMLTDRLQEFVVRRRGLRYKAARRTDFMCDLLFMTIMLVVDVALLPLECYATTQMLGLASTLPLVPPLRSLLPWDQTSIHHFSWQSLITAPCFRWTTFPAVLALLRSNSLRDLADETSIHVLSTSFRYPEIDECNRPLHQSRRKRPQLTRDPLGWMLQQTLDLRVQFMKWCGWTVYGLQKLPISTDTLDSDVVVEEHPDSTTITHKHRSTALAHTVPTFLACSIDQIFQTILFLPFDTLALRAIASSFMATPLSKKTRALDARLYSHTIFSTWTPTLPGGPRPTFLDFGHYASKIGLSLALQSCIHTSLFVSVYKMVRLHGTRNFDWGSRHKIGTVVSTFGNAFHVNGER